MMKKKSETLNSEQSLKIITDMIQKTRLNLKQSIFHLLFWGWLILTASLSEFLLQHLTSFEHPYYAWLLTIPGIFVSLIYGYRMGRKQSSYTYADRLNKWNWLAFMIVAIILFILFFDRMDAVDPYILLLIGYPTFMSGIITKYKPLILGGIIYWVLALIAFFSGPVFAQLMVPIAVTSGSLIPGYLLKKEKI